MKKFTINLIIVLLALNTFGQTYAPFPEDNAFWSAMHCEPGPYVPKSAFVKVGVFGDTLINGKTYHKLYLQGKFVHNFLCDTCGFVFEIDSASYFMSYREDNKVIYFVPQSNGFGDPSGAEYPIFDFNLSNVGDTVTGYEFHFLPDNTTDYGALIYTETLTVESIDFVMMSDGSYRRRINFEPLTYGLRESWIEGIGSTKGFGWSLNITNSYNTMICFSHNGIDLDDAEIRSEQNCNTLPDLNFPNKCEYTETVSINEIDKINDIVIFPNPFDNTIRIINLSPKDKVMIYDIMGQVVYKTISESNEITIASTKFMKGVYFYTISSDNKKTIAGILIKQ